MSGAERALIKQKLLSFTPKFDIFINGERFAEVVKHFTLTKQHFSVLGADWQILGNFLGYEYDIFNSIMPIVRIRKELFNFADAYSVDIDSYVDEVAALAVVLTIDAAKDVQN